MRRAAGGPCPAPYAAGVDETTTTTAIPAPSSTAIGPNGTAPGLQFIVPAELPQDDSSNTTTFSWPLGFAMIVLLAIFVSVLVRAQRARRRPEAGAPPGRDEPQLPDGSSG